MCYDSESRPPAPPVSGGAADATESVLTSSDGTRFQAFTARATEPKGSGIVILPDIRGLHGFYEELAVRFAEAGIHATAIDYFGRTAGLGTRDDDFDFMTHVPQTKASEISMDVSAAVAHLRSQESGGAKSIFTVGFCFGGRNSFNQAAEDHGLAGVIGFYGRLGEKRWDNDTPAPAELASAYNCPVLGLFGGDDTGIPESDVDAFRKALDEEEVGNEIYIYPGAPHSFFDRAQEQFADECDDAWRRVLAFIARQSRS